MAATATEKFRGASGDLTSHNITYWVEGASDDIDALQAVDAVAPVTYDGLTKDNFRYTEQRWPDLWEVEVSYTKKTRQPPETGAVEYAFEIGVSNQKIYTAYEQTTYKDPAQPNKDFYKAINVDRDRNVQGVDVQIPVSTFTISYYPAAAIVTSDYQKAVRYLVGKVNAATADPYPGFPNFYGHAPGELLFTGCSGRARNVTDWELTFSFAVSPNRTNVTIGAITPFNIKGWQVLWVEYEQEPQAGRFTPKPIYANVADVYESGDFTVLGI
jgi:hypothetical protein